MCLFCLLGLVPFFVVVNLSDYFMSIIFMLSCLLRGNLQKCYDFVVMLLEIQEQVLFPVYPFTAVILCLIYCFCEIWVEEKHKKNQVDHAFM